MYKHYFVEGKTLPEAYHKALYTLEVFGETLGCSDYNTKQKEIGITYFVEHATAEPMISKMFCGGHYELQQYKMEVLDGILDFKIGDGTCWEYTYHARYIWQLPWIYTELKRNPETRRAIMNIRDFAVDSTNADPACLQSIQFLIRDNKLHMKVMMRSNDAVQANFMNAFAFIMLQQKVANDLGYEVGSYTHTANSFHAYEKSFEILKKYTSDYMRKSPEDLTYEYEGFYKDLMDESIPKIMQQVQKLKDEMNGRKT